MRSTGPLVALAGAAVLALTLTGCAGNASGDKGLSYEDSPLSTYLSAAWGGDLSPEEQDKKMQEQNRKVEEYVAKCMSEEGFEYKPSTSSSSFVSSSDVEWEPDDKKWVEQYGYGIVHNPFGDSMPEEGEMPVDPNQDYVSSLSETEQTAYYETLYGPQPDESEIAEDGSFEYNWEEAGCMGAAQHEVMGADVWSDDEFADLRDKMNELWTNSTESPEYKKIDTEWAACMTEAGEPGFTAQVDASMSISDEQGKLYEAAYGDGTENIDPATIEDPSKSPEMKALGERELKLAVVDLECRTKVDYRERTLKLQFDLEEKFIAENKAALEAFKAAAEQSK